jgi:hypothetical protein
MTGPRQKDPASQSFCEIFWESVRLLRHAIWTCDASRSRAKNRFAAAAAFYPRCLATKGPMTAPRDPVMPHACQRPRMMSECRSQKTLVIR